MDFNLYVGRIKKKSVKFLLLVNRTSKNGQ